MIKLRKYLMIISHNLLLKIVLVIKLDSLDRKNRVKKNKRRYKKKLSKKKLSKKKLHRMNLYKKKLKQLRKERNLLKRFLLNLLNLLLRRVLKKMQNENIINLFFSKLLLSIWIINLHLTCIFLIKSVYCFLNSQFFP